MLEQTVEYTEQDREADEICKWAAARAGVIVVLPLVGTMALMANEVYLIIRLGQVYGVKITETAAAGFLMSLGATWAGQTLATLVPFPFMQLPIGVSVTYAVGKVAQSWIKAGMPNTTDQMTKEFLRIKEQAMEKIDELKKHSCWNIPLGDGTKKF